MFEPLTKTEAQTLAAMLRDAYDADIRVSRELRQQAYAIREGHGRIAALWAIKGHAGMRSENVAIRWQIHREVLESN